MWPVTIGTHPDARSVMLHILLGLEEVLEKLESAEGSPKNRGESLAPCIVILKNIWEVSDAYKRTIAIIVPSR